jgi:protein CpxP
MKTLRIRRQLRRSFLLLNRHALAAGIVMAALVAGGVTTAMAQQGPPPGPPAGGHFGHGMMRHGNGFRHMCVDMDARRAGRLAFVEVKLGITDSERPAWEKFVAASKAAEQPMRQLCSQYGQAPMATTLPDRLARREAIESARLESLRQVQPALVALYQALTPAQQHIADRFGPEGGHGHL